MAWKGETRETRGPVMGWTVLTCGKAGLLHAKQTRGHTLFGATVCVELAAYQGDQTMAPSLDFAESLRPRL